MTSPEHMTQVAVALDTIADSMERRAMHGQTTFEPTRAKEYGLVIRQAQRIIADQIAASHRQEFAPLPSRLGEPERQREHLNFPKADPATELEPVI